MLGVIAAGAAAVAWAATVPMTQGGRMDAVRAPAGGAPAQEPDTADSLVADVLRRPLFRPRPAPVAKRLTCRQAKPSAGHRVAPE